VEKAAAQIRRFLEQGVVLTTEGGLIPLEAESICVHGDGPNALEVIQALRRAISECGNAVAPLAGAPAAR
jgi:5-oxoprolinase (ATP-hydrolysing) subunit A